MSDLRLDQLPDGRPIRIEKNGTPICVARVNNQVFAVSDICSHSEASLSEGDISDFKIECWLHGAEFDLQTGKAMSLPATESIETYSVIVDGNSVTIEI